MANNGDWTASEAAGRYLAQLKEGQRATGQAELNRFVRWYGSESRVATLRSQEVETYQEQVEKTGADVARRLEPLKNFLVFLHKQGLTETNLGRLIKTRRAGGSRLGGRGLVRDDESVQMTQEGYDTLKLELEHLTTVKRAEIAHDLYEARIDKDFRENAPYDAAKQHQAEVEIRIRQLEHILSVARIVEQKHSGDLIGLGATVVLRDLTHNEELTYTIVGSSEANPRAGRISIVSPVGKALLDRHVGEEVEVAAPIGMVRYKVERIVE